MDVTIMRPSGGVKATLKLNPDGPMKQQKSIKQDGHEQHGVDTVEDATVPWEWI